MNFAVGSGRARGFTLIELLVVLAIVGLVSTLAASDLSSLIGTYRLNEAARRLVAEVHGCRARAISESRECAVILRESDPAVGNGEWQANVGRYEVQAATVGQYGPVFVPVEDGVVDLHGGSTAATGISIEPWVPLSGAPGLQLPDAVVFSPRGYSVNATTDFPDGVIRVVFRNKRTASVERRVVRIDRGGNAQIAIPE